MSSTISVERSSFENLISFLEVIHLEAGLVSWDTECSGYLDKLEFEINQMKLLMEYDGE